MKEREGICVRIEPRSWVVDLGDREVKCSLRPRLFEERPREKNPVAVGDRVVVRDEGERGVILRVLPRRNELSRPLPREHGRIQVTAANVDQVVSVSAAKNPPLRAGLIDRFQVAAEHRGMQFSIVVNKCDRGPSDRLRERMAVYERLGYPVVFTSAKTSFGVERLATLLKDRTSVLIGHSGVGKSSLLNALDPARERRTGAVARHGRGRHTTTSVSLWRLPLGGYVVDTPGIRGFGLEGIAPAELALLMPDLRAYRDGCRYPDCTHDHEPDCEVRAAVERGDVASERYASYRRMLMDILGVETSDGDPQ